LELLLPGQGVGKSSPAVPQLRSPGGQSSGAEEEYPDTAPPWEYAAPQPEERPSAQLSGRSEPPAGHGGENGRSQGGRSVTKAVPYIGGLGLYSRGSPGCPTLGPPVELRPAPPLPPSSPKSTVKHLLPPPTVPTPSTDAVRAIPISASPSPRPIPFSLPLPLQPKPTAPTVTLPKSSLRVPDPKPKTSGPSVSWADLSQLAPDPISVPPLTCSLLPTSAPSPLLIPAPASLPTPRLALTLQPIPASPSSQAPLGRYAYHPAPSAPSWRFQQGREKPQG